MVEDARALMLQNAMFQRHMRVAVCINEVDVAGAR
jgi:hypothetical protein